MRIENHLSKQIATRNIVNKFKQDWEHRLRIFVKSKLTLLINTIDQTENEKAVEVIEEYLFSNINELDLQNMLNDCGYELIISVNDPKAEYNFSEEEKASAVINYSEDDVTIELKKIVIKI